jgi:hypothetical protein
MRAFRWVCLTIACLCSLGCADFFTAILISTIQDAQQRSDGAKQITAGNTDRAILGDIKVEFLPVSSVVAGIEQYKNPALVNLTTGEQTPIELAPGAFGVESDGNFAVWLVSESLVEFQVLDLRAGLSQAVKLTLDTALDPATLRINRWVLSEGRILANLSDADTSPMSATVLLSLTDGRQQLLPPTPLVSASQIVGLTQFEVMHTRELRDIERDGVTVLALVAIDSRVVATNLETGQSETLLTTYALTGSEKCFATSSHVLWQESDRDFKRVEYRIFNYTTGELSSVERRTDSGGSAPRIESVGEVGFVLSLGDSVFLVTSSSAYEFIDFNGDAITLQFTVNPGMRQPVRGKVAILGNRVYWNDLETAALRFYDVISQERGTLNLH